MNVDWVPFSKSRPRRREGRVNGIVAEDTTSPLPSYVRDVDRVVRMKD